MDTANEADRLQTLLYGAMIPMPCARWNALCSTMAFH